jgi:hypothetical protein
MSHETSQEIATSAGSTDAPTYDPSLLETALGPITAREFDAAEDYTKPALWAWLIAIVNLTDAELYHASRSAIYESALVNRFSHRINFEHVHCKATACYSEAERRLKLEKHAEDCRPSGIYGRAHADVMTAYGYEPSSPIRPCTCGARYPDRHGEAPSDVD